MHNGITVAQILDNIASDEKLSFSIGLNGAVIIRRTKYLESTSLSSQRAVLKEQMEFAKFDILAEMIWQTAIEVRSGI